MKVLLTLIGLTLLLTYFYSSLNKKKSDKLPLSLRGFRNNTIGRKKVNERFKENISNSLMIDPGRNIKINKWDKEHELREKADIHRARLSKYGRSKMNGEMIFKGPKGGIYKFNSRGKRKYI